MISLPSGTRIWLVAGVTDMRKSFNGLGEQIQHVLDAPPSPIACLSSVAAGAIPSKSLGQMQTACTSSPNALKKGVSSGLPYVTARWLLPDRSCLISLKCRCSFNALSMTLTSSLSILSI